MEFVDFSDWDRTYFPDTLSTNFWSKTPNSKWRIQNDVENLEKLTVWAQSAYSGVLVVAEYEFFLKNTKFKMAD